MNTSSTGNTAAKKAAPSKGSQSTEKAPAKPEVKSESAEGTVTKAGFDEAKDAKVETIDAPQGQSQTGRPEDSGPGTGRTAPPETHVRYPAGLVTDPSAPLDPPADTPTQTDPEHGYNASTTDQVYAEAGGRTVSGEDFVGLVDGDDNAVSEGDLFDDDPAFTFVTVKGRVYEQFYYPNTHEKAKRLLFVPGQRVPRAQAEKIKTAVGNAPEPQANMTAAQRRGDSISQ